MEPQRTFEASADDVQADHATNDESVASVPATTVGGELAATRDVTPMSLIADLANEVDIDKLKELVAMQERWEDRQAERAYNAAMADCRKSLPAVAARGYNSQTKANYLKHEDVNEAINRVCAERGITIEVRQVPPPSGREDWVGAEVIVRHDGGHVERYTREAAIDDKGMAGKTNKTVMQGIQSTVSYLGRTAKMDLLGIVTAGDDRDGAGSGRPADPINGDQAMQLESKIDGVAADRGGDPETVERNKHFIADRLAAAMGVESIYDIPASEFASAMQKLGAL